MSYGADKLGVDTHTHTHTGTQTQATTIPEGQNWPRVKNDRIGDNYFYISLVLEFSKKNSLSKWVIVKILGCQHDGRLPCMPDSVTLDISWSPIESQGGSRKYPG